MAETRTAFYNNNEFSPLQILPDNWETIRDEFLELNAPVTNLHRIGKSHDHVLKEMMRYIQEGNPYGWVKGWGNNGVNHDWLQYALIVDDTPVPFVRPKMHKTLEILQQIKGVKVCALVKMKAHTFLSVHRHPEMQLQNLLQLHVPLVTAPLGNYAYLNVLGEFRQQVAGELIIFDGSLDHFAVNATPYDRTILYMEFKKNLNMI